MRKNILKKADDEQCKKINNYFEDKIKENKGLIQAIYQSMGKVDSNDSSVMKKGWTCLVCDKDVRNNY